jgi:hypothetical protein
MGIEPDVALWPTSGDRAAFLGSFTCLAHMQIHTSSEAFDSFTTDLAPFLCN